MADIEVWQHLHDTITLCSVSLAEVQDLLQTIDLPLANRIGELSLKARQVAQSIAHRLETNSHHHETE